MSPLTGGEGEGGGEVALAHAGAAEEDDVGSLGDELQVEQGEDLGAVDALGVSEVERVERLLDRDARILEAAFDEAFEACVGLGGDEAIKDLEVGDLLLRRRLEDLRVDLEDPRQVEGEEVAREALLGLLVGRHRWFQFPGRGRRARDRSPRG